MEQVSRRAHTLNQGNAWRKEVPSYAITFYEDAQQRLQNSNLEPHVRAVLEKRCEEIEGGHCTLDPDETVHMILEGFSD